MALSFHLTVAIILLMIWVVMEAREQTVRRSFTIETDEQEFISSYDSFLEDIDGNNTYSYWPTGVNPFEEFGLMQKAMISDILLQLCLMSGIYVRPPKKETPLDPNDTTLLNDTNTPQKKKKHTPLLDELLDLLGKKRQDPAPTPAPADPVPPVEDWQNDPYDLLKDAEDQFTNLCYTLFELRRLNRKLAEQLFMTRETPMFAGLPEIKDGDHYIETERQREKNPSSAPTPTPTPSTSTTTTTTTTPAP